MAVVVEVQSAHLAKLVGIYVVTHKLLADASPPLRIETCASKQLDGSRTILTLGVGSYAFNDVDGHPYVITRRQLGEPVPARGQADSTIHEEVQVTGPSTALVQALFAKALKMEDDADDVDMIQTYVWDATNEYWKRMTFAIARPLDSVVLPDDARAALLADLQEFDSEECRGWYRQHGIPHRRGYLFYGPPGCGKTSTITAIAGYLRRRVHRLSLVAPRLTDDSLSLAMAEVRTPALVVFEDVDALFDTHREKQEQFAVTFSGLLNAIDGVGDPGNGTLIVFTTNHKERLDPALCRRGRIDLKFHFGPATAQTARAMFRRFYPEASAHEDAFVASVQRQHVAPSLADLQEHFICHRTADAADATTFTPPAGDDADWHGSMWM